MSEVFDPYRKWLGIAPHEQPAHHYRLLGIAPFEDDPDVIENAADRQMAHVRTYQTGRHRDQSQRILNELAAAKNVLLDPAKKPSYDAWLHEALYAAEAAAPLPSPDLPAAPLPSAPLPAPPPPAPPPPRREPGGPPLPVGTLPVGQAVPVGSPSGIPVGAPVPAVAPSGKPRSSVRARARRKSSPVGMIVVCVVAGIAVVVAMVIILQQTADVEPTKSGSSSTVRKAAPSDPATKQTTPPPRTPPDKVAKTTPPAIDKAPPKLEDLPPDQRFKMAAIQVRDAFGRRDLEAAEASISSAEAMKSTDEDMAEVERLKTLHKYLDEFWKGVRAGIERSEPGDVLHYDIDELEFIAGDAEKVTIKTGENEREYRIADMPAPAAWLFARKGFDTQKDAKHRLYLAAFWTLDSKAASQPQAADRARRLWNEAAELGTVDRALAHAMGLSEEDISSAKPKAEDERLPKLPPVEKPEEDEPE